MNVFHVQQNIKFQILLLSAEMLNRHLLTFYVHHRIGLEGILKIIVHQPPVMSRVLSLDQVPQSHTQCGIEHFQG